MDRLRLCNQVVDNLLTGRFRFQTEPKPDIAATFHQSLVGVLQPLENMFKKTSRSGANATPRTSCGRKWIPNADAEKSHLPADSATDLATQVRIFTIVFITRWIHVVLGREFTGGAIREFKKVLFRWLRGG